MKRQQLMRGLIIASFGALAMTAGAQSQTQGDNPRGNSTPGNTPPNATQPGGTTSGMGTMNNGTTSNGTMGNGSMMQDKGKSQMYSDYKAARRSCDGMAAGQQEKCNNAANKKYSGIDPKCQKVSGSALDECIRGADHGG
jgi:hypothetical protein